MMNWTDQSSTTAVKNVDRLFQEDGIAGRKVVSKKWVGQDKSAKLSNRSLRLEPFFSQRPSEAQTRRLARAPSPDEPNFLGYLAAGFMIAALVFIMSA